MYIIIGYGIAVAFGAMGFMMGMLIGQGKTKKF